MRLADTGASAGARRRADIVKRQERRKPGRKDAIVRIEDLAPRKDPSGGSGKMLFGQDAARPETSRGKPETTGSKRSRERTP